MTRWRRFVDWPLRAKMAALLVAASLLPLAISTYVDLRQTEGRLLSAMESLLQARGDQIVNELDGFHRGYQRSADRISRFPDSVAYCAGTLEQRTQMQARMLSTLAAFPASDAGIRGAALLDGAGRVVIATETQLIGLDLSDRPAVIEAMRGRALTSDPFLSSPRSGNVPSISYFAPALGADRKVLCIAVLWVRAAALWTSVKASNALAGPGSFAVLFDREGIRIAHTYDDDIVFHPAGPLEPATLQRLVAEGRFGPRTRALLEDVRPFPEQFERARSATPDLAVFHGFAPVNKTWNYGVVRRFQTVPWTVFYMVPEAKLDAQIAQATREKLLFAAAIIAAAGFTGLLFASTILQPIRALKQAAAAIAGGDLSSRVQVRRSDELGEFGGAFNTMAERIQAQAASLQYSRDELERRVQERTAALLGEIAERSRIERELRERDAALHRAHLMTKLGHVITRPDGSFESWSDTLPPLVGLPPAQMPPSTREWMGLLHPDDRGLFRDTSIAAGASGTGKEVEYRLRRADGVWIHVRQVIEPIPGAVDGDGRMRWFSTLQDITDGKLAAQRLQAQLERLQLLDQITGAIGERQDLQSIYQVAIRSLEERLPVDFACICRLDPMEGVPDGVLTVIRVGAHSQPLAMELAMAEQARIPIDQNGLARCVRGELVYEPDIGGVAFPFPQRLALGGLRSLVIAPLQSESRVFGIVVVARQQPESFSSGDCEFLRQLSSHVALAARQAQLHGALQQAYDDLRQTQQTFMQQERLRALGQMASGIAHDINNAISPVALYTESLLETEPALSERGRRYLVTIARAIDDVAVTVARMREFYRQREPQLSLMPVKLNALVQQVLDLTQVRWSDMPQQSGAVIRLETELAPNLPEIRGIESEVREALINLVFNAVDAMPDGGVLSLRTRCTEALPRLVQVDVGDTGAGMDEETRRRCLEPFFTTKGERGTGLGLAMVYGVAQRHGADIEIDSAPGRGTTMRLNFPAGAEAPGEPAATLPLEARAARLRILIVDDDPLMLKSLCETLELDGHRVVTANGGQAGIDTFRGAPPDAPFDVVITDLGMPYIDGRKVAAAVKEAAGAPPVILLTGWGQRLLADGEVPPHVDRVLSKPPRLRDVRAALAQLTAGAGGEEAS